jgi:uncharacterized protein with NAD-binding domain and iron-sulfur cluster
MEAPQEVSTELTFEQSLSLRNFTDTLKNASPEQRIEIATFVYKQLLQQKNCYNKILKNEWGLK